MVAELFIIKRMKNLIIVLLLVGPLSAFSQTEKIKDEIWRLEEQYWQYVQTRDLVNYNKLWHASFIGYPSNNIITNKDHITDWIDDLYKDKNKNFSIELERKGENVFDDIVLNFYDVKYTWKNDKNIVIEKQHYKITHTWKKSGNSWLIIGGMGALISKEVVQ